MTGADLELALRERIEARARCLEQSVALRQQRPAKTLALFRALNKAERQLEKEDSRQYTEANALFAEFLDGRIRRHGFFVPERLCYRRAGGYATKEENFDALIQSTLQVFVFRRNTPLAIISLSTPSALDAYTNRPYAPTPPVREAVRETRGRMTAWRLKLPSWGGDPRGDVYLLMHRDAPEWERVAPLCVPEQVTA